VRTYTITLNETQAGTIQIACEVLARLGIGQFRDALEHLPTTEFMPPGWHEDMDQIGQILKKHTISNVDGWQSSLGIHHAKTHEEAKIAWDLYTLVRHRLSMDRAIDEGRIKPGEPRKWPEMMTVNYDDPHHTSKEPLAKIEEVKT
jgi:hypothetical protein